MDASSPYARHASHALRLLSRYGAVVKLTRTETSTRGDCAFDPNGTDPDGNPCKQTVEYDVTLLETGSTAEERSGGQHTILSTQLVGLLACPDDVTPSSSDQLRYGGRTVSITELSRVGPSPLGLPIVYEIVGSS